MNQDIESSVVQKSSLSDHQLAVLASETQKRSKNIWIAYVLWFFFGGLGGHRYYLNRVPSAIFMTALLVAGLLMLPLFGFGFVLLAPLAIWAVIDAFLIPGMVNRFNSEIESRIMSAVRAAPH